MSKSRSPEAASPAGKVRKLIGEAYLEDGLYFLNCVEAQNPATTQHRQDPATCRHPALQNCQSVLPNGKFPSKIPVLPNSGPDGLSSNLTTEIKQSNDRTANDNQGGVLDPSSTQVTTGDTIGTNLDTVEPHHSRSSTFQQEFLPQTDPEQPERTALEEGTAQKTTEKECASRGEPVGGPNVSAAQATCKSMGNKACAHPWSCQSSTDCPSKTSDEVHELSCGGPARSCPVCPVAHQTRPPWL